MNGELLEYRSAIGRSVTARQHQGLCEGDWQFGVVVFFRSV